MAHKGKSWKRSIHKVDSHSGGVGSLAELCVAIRIKQPPEASEETPEKPVQESPAIYGIRGEARQRRGNQRSKTTSRAVAFSEKTISWVCLFMESIFRGS